MSMMEQSPVYIKYYAVLDDLPQDLETQIVF